MLNHTTEQAAAIGAGEGTSSRRVRVAAMTLAGGAIGLAAEGALAQSSASKEPPAAPIATIGKSSDANFVTILLVLVLAIAIVAVNFIPSKRGHQD